MPAIKGFLDEADKQDHFQRHGADFAAESADEYEAIAVAFMSRDMTKNMVDCTRSGGDYLRFDKATQAFGICDKDGNLRTFFKPNRLIHRQRSNMEYFRGECKK